MRQTPFDTLYGFFDHTEILITFPTTLGNPDGPNNNEGPAAREVAAEQLKAALNGIRTEDGRGITDRFLTYLGECEEQELLSAFAFGRIRLNEIIADRQTADDLIDRFGMCGETELIDGDAGDDEVGSVRLINLSNDFNISTIDLDLALLYLICELRFFICNPDNNIDINVSPNWRLASSYGCLVDGGAGGQPIKDKGNNPDNRFELVLPAEINAALGAGSPASQAAFERLKDCVEGNHDGTPIDIFVLDTLTSLQQLYDAIQEIDNPQMKALFALLFDEKGERTCQPGTTFECTTGEESDSPIKSLCYYPNRASDSQFSSPIIHIPDHAYSWASHGPFIASLIHAIAPNARIHMVEVLNEVGIGTMKSLLWGIRHVQKSGAEKFLINCSLTLAARRQRKRPLGSKPNTPDQMPHPVVGSTNAETAIQRLILLGDLFGENPDCRLDIFELFRQTFNRLPAQSVVAAAGNDSNTNVIEEAGLPAALNKVIGVGALKSNLRERAAYSNEADKDENNNPAPVFLPGYWAMGGDVSNGAADPNCGLLGIYPDKTFPGGVKNDTGWARWAGTSFATPIVTGLLAQLLMCDPELRANGNVENARAAARKVLDELIEGEAVPLAPHNMIPLRQKACQPPSSTEPPPSSEPRGCLEAIFNLLFGAGENTGSAQGLSSRK